ncbi:gas vesicle protein K [Dactylosporangium darangshiense]|uniref:Gas vesicle protein K n=1 Tax=Dactylosporangium darangshiense TaxID=579108 RepID=A0ABP8DDV5_9ACTN
MSGERPRPRIELDRDDFERGFASLVLTVIELVRQLMERQALRRIDVGDLTDDQVERIGETLMALEERMGELRERFGLSAEDLGIGIDLASPPLPPRERP